MKKLTIIFLLGLFSTAAFSQGPPPPMFDEEKIEPLRIAFLTKYLDLTSGPPPPMFDEEKLNLCALHF